VGSCSCPAKQQCLLLTHTQTDTAIYTHIQ
jgi:hypothetical protein